MQAMRRDLYAVLGVDRAASERDIRQAYKRLALRLHPDKSREEIGQRVDEILRRYPGQRKLEISVGMTDEILKPEKGVRPCDDLYQELYDLTCE